MDRFCIRMDRFECKMEEWKVENHKSFKLKKLLIIPRNVIANG